MTRVARVGVLPLACAVALPSLLLGGAAYAQTFVPQPYLVYEESGENLTPPPLVDLDDQFILEEDVEVESRDLLMNPVTKTPLSPPGQQEAITDPLLHYSWYWIYLQSQGTYSVLVTNQFGDHLLWTIADKPEMLLAPASKALYPEEPGPPPPGQHYACYAAWDAPPANALVDLEDQFGPHGDRIVEDPAYLCVPVEKTAPDGTVYPIFQAADGRDHLACYWVEGDEHTEVVNTRTQFTNTDPDTVSDLSDSMLCVPSEKTTLEFEPQPYLVYEVPPEPVVPPPLVDLDDQFIQPTEVPVVDRGYFMNPVEKLPSSPPGNPEPITDPELHYRWHTIDVECGGTRIVQVANQFTLGDEVPWEIESAPDLLLAPASKIIGTGDPGPPPPGQHYDCYSVVSGPSAMATVTLVDQFGEHSPSEVTAPRYFCAPAEKTTEGGRVYPIFEAADGRDHLACYDVTPHPHTEVISTRDQFTGSAPDEGPVIEDRMLCVPTLKTKTYKRVPSLAPWGIATLGLLMLLIVFWVAQRRATYGKPA